MNKSKAQRHGKAMSEAKIQRRREVQSAYYYRNRQLTSSFLNRQAEYEYFANTGKKICKACGEAKEPAEFYTDNKAADKLTRDCKECRLDISLSNYYKRKEGK